MRRRCPCALAASSARHSTRTSASESTRSFGRSSARFLRPEMGVASRSVLDGPVEQRDKNVHRPGPDQRVSRASRAAGLHRRGADNDSSTMPRRWLRCAGTSRVSLRPISRCDRRPVGSLSELDAGDGEVLGRVQNPEIAWTPPNRYE
jgi:hypothetical protein